MKRLFFAILLTFSVARGQDERRVLSPDGRIEFRLFIATQGNSNLSRLAYKVSDGGAPILDMSFMGLDILNQEPMLGENVGLTSSSSARSTRHNSLIAKYMQNGSLGRLIDVEVRAYDDGVAFRYVIPVSTPLVELLIAEEATEFRFTRKAFEVRESKSANYPPMRLNRNDPQTMITRLTRRFEGTTPLTCPWRIIVIRTGNPGIVADLKGR